MPITFRKPSVAKGTKIVYKMLRQIDNEIALFEATQIANVIKAEQANTKGAHAAAKAVRIRNRLYALADNIAKAIDTVVYKQMDKHHAIVHKYGEKRVELLNTNVEHTADINKLTRIRDKVATLAD